MTIPTVTALPDAPTRADSATFDTRADVFMPALVTLATKINATVAATNTATAQVTADAATASTAASSATASASAAAAVSGAAAWASGTTYAANAAVIGTDGQTYRSMQGGNTNHNPVGNGGTWWVRLTNADRAVPLAEGTITSGAANYATGYVFSATISGTTTISITNLPASGSAIILLKLTNGGSKTVNWPSGTKWPGGTAPTLTASGLDEVILMRTNAGVWSGAVRKDVK